MHVNVKIFSWCPDLCKIFYERTAMNLNYFRYIPNHNQLRRPQKHLYNKLQHNYC